MKKLLGVLTSIALVAVIIAAGLFGYSNFKDLMEGNKDNKTEVSNKNEKKENKKQEQKQEEVDSSEEVNNNLNMEEYSQPEPRNGRTKEEEVQAAIEASDREMEQIEREESYNPNIPKEQMEIYEKRARGELPQPGEGPRSEVAEEDMIEE
ncbi:hypothetical protein [Staphylococcus rostri]|uniref:Uncharacterized protein n=1 Tax=Staphylococcus rostri TaxID=522262 RepID=A0A2K3YYB7_9STAP|nr:hypothetical protein [Staphylococcus rostri]PNZ30188.1 hypothetical protein CD122_00825 [Staphylococcus rostri]HDK8982020.1 hypothetical protein [Staphylococcus aureus]HDK9005992.1 hypothetical protein [Staphylococcus aureus]